MQVWRLGDYLLRIRNANKHSCFFAKDQLLDVRIALLSATLTFGD